MLSIIRLTRKSNWRKSKLSQSSSVYKCHQIVRMSMNSIFLVDAGVCGQALLLESGDGGFFHTGSFNAKTGYLRGRTRYLSFTIFHVLITKKKPIDVSDKKID